MMHAHSAIFFDMIYPKTTEFGAYHPQSRYTNHQFGVTELVKDLDAHVQKISYDNLVNGNWLYKGFQPLK